MSSTALKTLAVVLVIAAAVLGFAAYRFSQGLTESQETAEAERPPQPGENQVLAVVAVDRLAPYETVTQESVALVPISVEPPQYYTDVSEVVGRTPLRPVPVGSPVSDDAFGSADTLAHAIPPDSQAMSLEISDVIAVGGFVQPGDMVDVLVYIRSSGQEVGSTQSRVLLENARVLAYEERRVNVEGDAGGSGDGDRQTRRQRTAVVAVPEDDTTRVMLGASLGELRLSLRGSEPVQDTRVADAGDGRQSGDGDEESAAEPEALSPQAIDESAQSDGDEQTSADEADGKDEDEDERDEKVLTLKELAAIEEAQEAEPEPTPTRPRQPPRATIEVYQGTESSRINRPY